MKDYFVLVTHKIDAVSIARWAKVKRDLSSSDISCFLAIDTTRIYGTESEYYLRTAIENGAISREDLWEFNEDSVVSRLKPLGYEVKYYEPGGKLFYGNVMLAYMDFFINHDSSKISHYWFVEHDVAYTGNWLDLVKKYESIEADYVSFSHLEEDTTADAGWFHYGQWETKTIDPFRESDLVKTFNPIMRLSRRALAFLDSLYREGNSGFYEIFLGTVLDKYGFTLDGFLDHNDTIRGAFTFLSGGRSVDLSSLTECSSNKLIHPAKRLMPFEL